jgi:hypothetical protein
LAVPSDTTMPVTVGEVSVLFETVAVFVVVKTLLGVMMFDNTVMVYAVQGSGVLAGLTGGVIIESI